MRSTQTRSASDIISDATRAIWVAESALDDLMALANAGKVEDSETDGDQIVVSRQFMWEIYDALQSSGARGDLIDRVFATLWGDSDA